MIHGPLTAHPRGSGLSIVHDGLAPVLTPRPVLVPPWSISPAEPRVRGDIDAVPVPRCAPGRSWSRTSGSSARLARTPRASMLYTSPGNRRRPGGPAVLRRYQRPRLVILRPDEQIVGDEEVLEPPPVVADFQAHARQHFLLHRHAKLPVRFPGAPPFQHGRVDDRQARIGIAEVEVIPPSAAQRSPPDARLSCSPVLVRSQSIRKFRLPSVHGRAVTRVTVFTAGLFAA